MWMPMVKSLTMTFARVERTSAAIKKAVGPEMRTYEDVDLQAGLHLTGNGQSTMSGDQGAALRQLSD